MIVDTGPNGHPARVRFVSEDGHELFVEFRSGVVSRLQLSDPSTIQVGDVVLVDTDASSVSQDSVPEAVFGAESWVGVVRRVLDDESLIVDVGGRLRKVRSSAIKPSTGNTVLANDEGGVEQILAPDPIPMIDLPTIDDSVIEGFLSKDTTPATFDDFAGAEDIVARAKELIELPLTSADALAAIGARAVKGVLFTGPPGTGKTLLARILAATSGAAFYNIRGPEVYSKWVGEAEDLLRKLFDHASRQERAILFFDEIDSIAPRRDSDSHESGRRIVAQLLTLMDGFHARGSIVVIAATNRRQDIDPALLRPGRFDLDLAFPEPNLLGRVAILQTTARHLNKQEPLPYEQIAGKTEGWTGADLEVIWTEAALLAVGDGRSVVTYEDAIGGFERVSRRQRPSEAQGQR